MKDLQHFKVLVVFIKEFFIVWYFPSFEEWYCLEWNKICCIMFPSKHFMTSFLQAYYFKFIYKYSFEECHLILFLVVIFIYIDVTVFCQYHHWKEKTKLCFQVQDNNIRVIALYSSQHWECNVYIKTEESIFYSSPKNFINFNQTTIIFRTLFQVVCVCFVVLINFY